MRSYYYYRFIEKVCERYHAFRIMETPVGFKTINVGLFKSPQPVLTNSNNDTIMINPADLFLSIDYLKDDFSLLGCNILDSPHLDLMKSIDNGKDINETDYIKRFRSGTLDARYPHFARDISFFLHTYKARRDKIDSGEIEPIHVYKVGNICYIKDGKHRAALCAYLGRPIECHVLDNGKMVSTIGRIVSNMMATKKEYSKHIELFNELNNLNNKKNYGKE